MSSSAKNLCYEGMLSVLEWKITFELHLQFVGYEVKMIYLLDFTLKNAVVSTLRLNFELFLRFFGYHNKMICLLKLPKIRLIYDTCFELDIFT